MSSIFKIELAPKYESIRQLQRFTTDPWIAMLALGALGHHWHNQFLLHLSYVDMWLAVIAIQALWGIEAAPTYKIRPANKV